MVVTTDGRATEAGVAVLRAGGNAVDAGVAVAFALTVTYPLGACLGGGGFMLYRAGPDEHHALDFRERAPGALKAELFLDDEGRPIPDLSLRTGLAVGVPGSVAGLAEAHRRWGSRSWSELLQPAIRLAEQGFTVGPMLALAFEREADRLRADPEARRVLTRDGEPYREGELLVQPDLAATLRAIAERGSSGFYDGPTAAAIVDTVSRAGGVMRVDDLAAYRPVLRRPIVGSYRGHRVVGFPPPSSAGITLLQILGMLERFDLEASGYGSSATTHLIVEAERRGFADRSRWLGDPAFFAVPSSGLLQPEYIARLASGIRVARATPSAEVHPGRPAGADDHETLHFSIGDAAGRVVAMTLTLNQWFGTGIVAPGTGVLLNNEMDDFALAPGVPNLYGLLGGEANAVDGGKRPLSSMGPTIVELADPGPRPRLVLGSPGGSLIITSVLQVLVNVVDHGMPVQQAVNAPRFHHQWHPDEIRHESLAFPVDVQRNLRALGHVLVEDVWLLGNVNAIGLGEDGAWLGAADPRRFGSAAGY
jgi:gamma-glutamyltranspeptidase/glutathione hydrolase